jgi:hypothetical protein
MKRLLIVLVALGLLIAFAGPAGAAKPDKPGKPDGPVGLTCAESYWNDPKTYLGVFSSSSGYTTLEFTLTKELSAACFDVTSGDGEWSMKVAGGAAPREMNVMIRDSAPGDFCGEDGYQVRRGDAVIGNWIFPAIPASAVDACGLGFDDHDPQLAFWLNARNLPSNEVLTITVTVPTLASS